MYIRAIEGQNERDREWRFLLFKWIFHHLFIDVIHHFGLFLSFSSVHLARSIVENGETLLSSV